LQVLFRRSFNFEGELEIARQHGDVKEYRSECSGGLVIGRYSVLPYYRELEQDLAARNAYLINNYRQHRWIANFEYYDILAEYTFPTWTDDNFHRCSDDGPFVVKGRTNSRKHQWNTLCFAQNKQQAGRIAAELYNDPLLGEQGIIYRKYVPLEAFEIGINDIPFNNEWRLFFLQDRLLSCGYYWSQADKAESYKIPQDCIDFAQKIANIACEYTNFFVLDIAKTQNRNWVLVEINDGQMSGLSMCDPHEFYRNIFMT
jgi:hypothetical protein